MTDDAADQRIAALEHEVRNLRMRLASQRRTLPAHNNEPTVRVTLAPLRRVLAPSDEEFDRLVHLVLTCWPQLHRGESFDSEFRAAFIYLLHTGRTDRLDMLHAVTWWCDTALGWLREHKLFVPVSLGGTAFIAAAIAHGDIGFSSPADFPHVSFALQFGGGGRRSCDHWREVLATERLSDPVPSPRPTAPRSPARQIAIGYPGSSFGSVFKGP